MEPIARLFFAFLDIPAKMGRHAKMIAVAGRLASLVRNHP
jgi:hypothetical protein